MVVFPDVAEDEELVTATGPCGQLEVDDVAADTPCVEEACKAGGGGGGDCGV